VSVRGWTARYWIAALVVMVATGYAVYERSIAVGDRAAVSHGDLIVGLTSNYQLDAFVLVPAWLLSGTVSLGPRFRNEVLVRGGSRLTLVGIHFRSRLLTMSLTALVISVVWILGTSGLSSFTPGHVRFVSGLLAIASDYVAHLLLFAGIDAALVGSYLLGGRLFCPACVSVAVWCWGLLGLVGSFPQDAPTNLLAYGNAVDLLSQPQLIGWLVFGTSLLLGLTLTAAWMRDVSGLPQVRNGGVVGVALAAVVLAGAVTASNRAEKMGAGFFGYDGTLVGYLPGGIVVLLCAFYGLRDVHRYWDSARLPVLIRSGSETRWLVRVWTRGSLRTIAAAASAFVVLSIAQAAALSFVTSASLVGGIAVLVSAELWFTIGLLVLSLGGSVLRSATSVVVSFVLGAPALPTGVIVFAAWTAPYAPVGGILLGALAVVLAVGMRLAILDRVGLLEGLK
jgi:hypothetical protein